MQLPAFQPSFAYPARCLGTMAIALAMTVALASSVVTANAAGGPAGTQLEQFNDWVLLADGPAKTVCFIASQSKTEPAATPREAAVLYVSAWPKEGIKGELSARLSVKPKKGADISLSVGAASFKLFARDDRVFVDDATRELKLIEALKKGAKATLRVEPEKGGPVSETFSLAGFGQALQALAAHCP